MMHSVRIAASHTPIVRDADSDAGSASDSSPSGMNTACYVACLTDRHDAVRILLALGAQADHYWDGCKCPKDIGHRPGCKCVQCKSK